MELLVILLLSFACLLLAWVAALLGAGCVLALAFLFREQGRLRHDVEKVDEVLAELLATAGLGKEPTNNQATDPMGVTR